MAKYAWTAALAVIGLLLWGRWLGRQRPFDPNSYVAYDVEP